MAYTTKPFSECEAGDVIRFVSDGPVWVVVGKGKDDDLGAYRLDQPIYIVFAKYLAGREVAVIGNIVTELKQFGQQIKEIYDRTPTP